MTNKDDIEKVDIEIKKLKKRLKDQRTIRVQRHIERLLGYHEGLRHGYLISDSRFSKVVEEHDKRIYEKARKFKLEVSKQLGFDVIDTLMLKGLMDDDLKSLLNETKEK